MRNTTTTPEVWIGCLACYNNGQLVGEWYDAEGADEVSIEIVHKDGGAHDEYGDLDQHEEIWVFDHQGFGGLLKGECSPDEAYRIATLISEIDDDRREALAAWLADRGESLTDEAIRDFDDHYHGLYDSERDYAEEYGEEFFDTNSPMFVYIDWDKFARDLFLDGYMALAGSCGRVHVFTDR